MGYLILYPTPSYGVGYLLTYNKNHMKKALLLAAIACAQLSAWAAPTWQIGPKYNITFSGGEVGGIFKTLKGTIAFDEADLNTSSFMVSVAVASINTGNALMNKHAKSADWFDAAKYPEIKFTTNKIVKSGAGYQATGTLELHGIKQEVSIPFTFKAAGKTAMFNGTFEISRSTFQIGKPSGEVSDKIKLVIAVPVTKN
jgi:polyisoprenoid-binding protein YceI